MMVAPAQCAITAKRRRDLVDVHEHRLLLSTRCRENGLWLDRERYRGLRPVDPDG
jgi:hypothetical protein